MSEKILLVKDMIQDVVKILVDNPDEVRVETTENEQSVVVSVSVAKEDLGKVIGKNGRTAGALRHLIGAVSTKMEKRMLVDILD